MPVRTYRCCLMATFNTRWLLVTLTGMSLVGCSATRLAYNNLDSVISWQLSRALGLEAPQRSILNEDFPLLWEWHRHTQLPLYADDLRELGAAAQTPLPQRDVEHYMQRTSAHFVTLWQELQPYVTRMLQSLDDRQVERLMGRIAEWRQEQAAESVGLGLEALQSKAAESMQKNVRRWTGRLNDEQRERIRQWAEVRHYDPELELHYREAWATAFLAVLDRRREDGFEDRLQALFHEPQLDGQQAVARLREHNRKAWLALAVDLSASLTPRQRRHFQNELEGLARDFEVLAARGDRPSLGRVPRDSESAG
jgi:hypothetical protein